jgi:phosphatidylglycerol:prolipoprotein diacylglycerol transferase
MSTFALLLGLGASLGLWQVARLAPPRQAGRWVDVGLVLLAGMLVGARAAYVATHMAYYVEHPGEWLRLDQGGYLAWGALPAALLLAALAALVLDQPLTRVLDQLSPLVAPLAVLGWLGCLAAGCAYGPLLPAGAPLGLPAPDEWGRLLPRFPLQLIAALLLLGYNWAVARVLPVRARAGRRAALTGLGLAVVQFSAALVSAEPLPLWNGLPFEAWSAAALAAFSLLLAGYAFWPGRK